MKLSVSALASEQYITGWFISYRKIHFMIGLLLLIMFLAQMSSQTNSSKSNRLPDWNHFFQRFAVNQYLMYGMIHEKEGIRRLYEACYKDNLHSIWANQELYRKGNSEAEFYGILEKNMRPVWDSARRQGYEVWER